MAIPGYETDYVYDYSDSEYYDYVATLVGILGSNHAEVISNIKKMRQDVKTYADFNILTPEGHVDLSKVSTPTFQELRDAEIEVVVWDEEEEPVASGFINGRICIFIGSAAKAFIQQWTLPAAQQLLPPILYVSDKDSTLSMYGVSNSPQLVFVATFMTRWGETGPSNSVTVHAQNLNKWSLTLEVDPEQMPSYATSVRYYRYFDVFRLIKEIPI